MANDKTKRSIKICFAVLLHNKREIAQDMFSRRYIQRLLTCEQFNQLKWQLFHTKALGVDEIVYVMMAERIGIKPKSYPIETGKAARYRPLLSDT